MREREEEMFMRIIAEISRMMDLRVEIIGMTGIQLVLPIVKEVVVVVMIGGGKGTQRGDMTPIAVEKTGVVIGVTAIEVAVDVVIGIEAAIVMILEVVKDEGMVNALSNGSAEAIVIVKVTVIVTVIDIMGVETDHIVPLIEGVVIPLVPVVVMAATLTIGAKEMRGIQGIGAVAIGGKRKRPRLVVPP
jgi:hypothetical protein